MSFDEFWQICLKAQPELTSEHGALCRVAWEACQRQCAAHVLKYAEEHIGKVLYHPEYALKELAADLGPLVRL